MSDRTAPSPAPWMPVWGAGGALMVVSTGGDRAVAVAAVNGSGSQEANCALICIAPVMRDAILADNITAARAALADVGLA